MRPTLIILLVALTLAGPAAAHEVRPGYLEIRETGSGHYSVRFRQPIVPAAAGLIAGLDLKVIFPEGCERDDDARYERADGYLTERFGVRCAALLGSNAVVIDGLQRSITDVYATFVGVDGQSQGLLLNAARPDFSITGENRSTASGYLRVGIEHMLGGLDHVLFVLGLLLLVSSVKRLVVVVTFFTVAHSITLGLAVLGLVRLPVPPIEAGIALSIVFLAYELTRPETASPSVARRHPEYVAFAFGLLHGFGFASALSLVGLPSEQVLGAMLLFNVGVEIGQLLVVAVFTLSLWLLRAVGPGAIRLYREAITWVLGVGAVYFFASTLTALV